MDFPARALVRFFRNHALLSHSGQHQWWTVSGGSIEYVRRIEAYIRAQGATIRTGTPVQSVIRNQTGVLVTSRQGQGPFDTEAFDEVIFACHSDQALRLLEAPTVQEARVLGDLRYQDNHAYLHCDPAQMPHRRACWASWVYKAEHDQPQRGIGVTYWMNRLQNIPDDDPLFVTLNPTRPPRDEMIYDQTSFRHPVFDHAALRAQEALRVMQGDNHTWFAGAYTRHGFHEDGFASAVRIARVLEPALV